ncbi:MAG: hypothetical protein Q8O32_03655 [bacterium]|nr:hypothetical protein [bacterium]
MNKIKTPDEKRIEKLTNILIFQNTFPILIEKEKSYFGKIILQENYITFIIISLVNILQQNINMDIAKPQRMHIKINQKELESSTLGGLIKILRTLSPENNLIKNLSEYNKLRNILTHKMMSKYNNFKQINIDVEKLNGHGSKLLIELSNMHQKIVADGLEKIRAIINGNKQ